MKKLLVLSVLLGIAFAFAGCSTPHTVVMRDGEYIHTKGEPSFNSTSGFYEFEDTGGRKHKVNKDEVRAIQSGQVPAPSDGKPEDPASSDKKEEPARE